MVKGYYLDDGTEVDVDSIPIPSICLSCIKNHKDNFACNITRIDQLAEITSGDKFCCFEFEPKDPTINKDSMFAEMEEYLNNKRINSRDNNITEFICGCYCQLCDNDKCNIGEIMEKYQSNWLTAKQMEEVNEFELHKVACKNHKSNEGFEMFAHKIEILYKDGRTKEMPGWYSPAAISELWDDDVADVEILFTDI